MNTESIFEEIEQKTDKKNNDSVVVNVYKIIEPEQPDFLKLNDLAKKLSLSPSTIRKMTTNMTFKVGIHIFYFTDEGHPRYYYPAIKKFLLERGKSA